MASRRLFLMQVTGFLAGCTASRSTHSIKLEQLTVGTVAYGEGARSAEQYQRFIDHLQTQAKTLVQLEPAFNEVKAMEAILRQSWSLVFAPPGLAAIAISKAQYLPLFPLQGLDTVSAALVVRDDSPMTQLTDVNGQVIALGQVGSATGYYVPLYELYGTAPAAVKLMATPQEILAAIASQSVDMGAMSKDELGRYQGAFPETRFRVLHNSRRLPPGSVLISPNVERNQQEVIYGVMNDVLPAIAQEAGYIPNAKPPDYETLIAFIQKVEPIEARIHETPAPLYTQ